MAHLEHDASASRARRRVPWTLAGGPDPGYDDGGRQVTHALLTDPGLLSVFRRCFPGREDADYDEMVRLLEYVWDCPHDGSANVAGYCCAGCGHTRASASVSCSARERRTAQ